MACKEDNTQRARVVGAAFSAWGQNVQGLVRFPLACHAHVAVCYMLGAV